MEGSRQPDMFESIAEAWVSSVRSSMVAEGVRAMPDAGRGQDTMRDARENQPGASIYVTRYMAILCVIIAALQLLHSPQHVAHPLTASNIELIQVVLWMDIGYSDTVTCGTTIRYPRAFTRTASMLMSAGVMPGIRAAWPRLTGWMRASFSLASRRSAEIEA